MINNWLLHWRFFFFFGTLISSQYPGWSEGSSSGHWTNILSAPSVLGTLWMPPLSLSVYIHVSCFCHPAYHAHSLIKREKNYDSWILVFLWLWQFISHTCLHQSASHAWWSTWRSATRVPPAISSSISHTHSTTLPLTAPCRTLCVNWCHYCRRVSQKC